MKRIPCKYRLDAIEILKKEGISFDEVKGFYPNNALMQKLLHKSPLVTYFMRGNTDVAYFTLDALIIHDTPRFWSQDNLNSLRP